MIEILSVPFSSEEEDAEFTLGLGCRGQQALQVAGGNAGLVLGEVSTKRERVNGGALGVPFPWEKAWGPWPAVSVAGARPWLGQGPCLQGATVFWDVQSQGSGPGEVHR